MKIKTCGPVDERSRKQLERCMDAGDAEHGVLCADHHPGYSQPIGGAIVRSAPSVRAPEAFRPILRQAIPSLVLA